MFKGETIVSSELVEVRHIYVEPRTEVSVGREIP